MNRPPGLREAVPHAHVEGVEGVYRRVALGELARVEAAAELNNLARALGRAPGLVHLRAGQAQFLARVDGRVRAAVLEDVGPGLAEELRELVVGHGEFRRRRDRRLGRDGVVVLVDQFLLVNILGRDVAFGQDGKAGTFQLALDELDRRRRHGVGLHEDEGRVLDGLQFAAAAAADRRRGGARRREGLGGRRGRYYTEQLHFCRGARFLAV